MKKTTNKKTKLTASIAIVLLMISAFVVIINVPVQAQEIQPNGSVRLPTGVTPDVTIKTKATLSFTPNPVGVDQTILVNMWTSPALHRSRYHTGYKVTIEDPQGNPNVITMDSYHADATAWFPYLLNQVGTWRLKFEFPGGYFPAGIYIDPRNNQNVTFPGSCYYEPSSTGWQELVVQQNMVISWPPSPLPADYWTRPVPFEHREWTSILGDFPWRGPGGGADWPANTNKYWDTRLNFIPYVQGPNTAHIVWKRIGAISGLVGAGQGYDALTRGSGGPSIVYQGKCYQSVTVPGGESGLQCYDLRTGEMYWEISPSPLPAGTSLQGIEYTGLTTPAVPGAIFQASAGASFVAFGSYGDRLVKINPWTGAVTLDVPIDPSRKTYYRNGYVLAVQNLGGGNYRLLNWTTFGSSSDFADRIISNITWPFSRPPAPSMGFDFEAGYADNTVPISPPEVRAITSLGITVASLEDGAVMWSDTFIDNPPFDGFQAYCADHGKIAVVIMGAEGGVFKAWDLETGNLAWTSEVMDYPWDATGFGSYGVASAYGLLWRFAYSGIYAFNWTNGEIVWKYEAKSPYQYETPYIGKNNETVYPFDSIGWVADGKVYAVNSEHTPTAPITRGWGVHCIDAMTGDLVWKMIMPSGGVGGGITGTPGGIAAIVDGYMVVSSLDGYMYVFGKGKTITTVSAPQTSVAKGTTMVITGTVLDQSPGQPGTPCVSADSMTTQMEYLHMQQPIEGVTGDEVITGVPVTLTAIGENGEQYNLGTATTEGYHGTFGLEWTPQSEGLYEIRASFDGDDSYGSSSASTWVTVGPAPSGGQPQETEEPTTEAPTTEAPTTEAPTTEAPTTEAPTTEAPTTEQPSGEALAFPTTEVAIVAAVAVAAIIGVGAYWILRRRK